MATVALNYYFLGLPFVLSLAPQVALSLLNVDVFVADLQIVLLLLLLALVRIDRIVELLSRLLRLENVGKRLLLKLGLLHLLLGRWVLRQ